MKRQWSIFIKIQILIISILLALYIAVEIALVGIIGVQLEEDYKSSIQSTAVLVQKNMEMTFNNVMDMLNYLALDFRTHTKEEEKIYFHLQTLQEAEMDILNLFIVFEDGTFLLTPPADIPPTYDPRDNDYYKDIIGRDGIYWSTPYEDQATGNKIITASQFARLADGTKSVIGADITLVDLNYLLSSSAFKSDNRIYLLSEKDIIIVSNDDNMVDKTLAALEDEALIDSKLITGELKTDKGLYFIRRLNQSNMRLMIFVPMEALNGATRQAQILMTLVATIILVVGIIISNIITRRVAMPLLKLTEIMTESTSSHDMILYEGSTNDEINSIIKQYNALATHINEQNDVISHLAYVDELTGMPNRTRFGQLVKEAMVKGEYGTLFYLDIDNFKYINDTYGHDTGDLVLKHVARSIEDNFRKATIISRLGGDEFAIYLSDYDNEMALDVMAHKIITLVKNPLYIEQLEFNLTASLGISRYPQDGEAYDTILANADIAMYEAKSESKDGYAYFNPEMKSRFVKQIKIETRLQWAIEHREIFVVYQPLINLSQKGIYGFEALARWTDEELGPIFPDVFIPIAERTLLINNLGRYIMEQAVAFAKELYFKYNRYYEINVNVSVVQLHMETFVEEVLAILDNYYYPPEYLNLEITESVTLESDEHIMMKLAYLRKKGIKISLDDFGTGYSSLNHLTDMSLTHIKIDRQLMLKARQSREIFQLMKGIVEFAHTMEYQVVAEGIEDQAMEDMITNLHADFGQGYLYAKPLLMRDVFEYIEGEALTSL